MDGVGRRHRVREDLKREKAELTTATAVLPAFTALLFSVFYRIFRHIGLSAEAAAVEVGFPFPGFFRFLPVLLFATSCARITLSYFWIRHREKAFNSILPHLLPRKQMLPGTGRILYSIG